MFVFIWPEKKSNDRVTQNRFCVDELALASIRWVPERPWCVLTLFDSSFDHRVKPCRTRTLEGLLVVKQLSFQVRTPPSFNPEPCISLTLPNSAGRSSAVQDRRPSSWRSLLRVSLRIGRPVNLEKPTDAGKPLAFVFPSLLSICMSIPLTRPLPDLSAAERSQNLY